MQSSKVAPESAAIAGLKAAIACCMCADRPRLLARVKRVAESCAQPGRMVEALAGLKAAIAESAARREQRLARLPSPAFPEALPISQRVEEIARAIESHQVVIVCGETGSGKSTQLPKVCLALRRGAAGMIGHTQPRRIAARMVASRVAQELGTELGRGVGYKVRFHDRVGPDTYLKVMTDGVLLAETQGDPELRAYDTLIIDEAHERSLNIDFLLGYVKRLQPLRPDLKLIITSATIDAGRFSRHFDNAPAIEVSGRLYPVEVRYRAVAGEEEEDEGRDVTDAILDAVGEVSRAGPGDVLVFLPGEREIRETAEALRKHHPPGTEILPLYARLSAAEQERVFQPSRGRRIVLATNVAETSLTVPGIRYVIDPGYARVNRYSYRNKVEQLVTEKISQASANQRAGRCGRVAAGVCVRLYPEEDYAQRARFTDPEILRSSLAAVILRMKALGLGDVERFPFLDPPAPRMINDGYQLLAELGAVNGERELTPLGRDLARLPIDPRIGRMVLAAKRGNCLREVLVIAAALSVQDPRERPAGKAQAADEVHGGFADERSDFLGHLKLWAFHEDALRHRKSNRRFRDTLREHFLSFVRMREWRDIHGQLHALVTEMGLRENEAPASYEEIHRALLTGLLGNIGRKSEESGDYHGVRGLRFHVHPGSALRKRAPKWVMASELVETARLYARCVARIEPEWVEQVASHLCKRTHFEPRWEKSGAQVVAFEQVSLYGLIVVPRRRVHYGPVDPKEARAIFIREALVRGEFDTQAEFFRANQRLRREVEELEHKSRRRDVLVDEERMFAFYDARIPRGVTNGADFEQWLKEAERADRKLVFMTREDLMRHEAQSITAALYPDEIEVSGMRLRLRYRFDPGHPLDGVTVTVPLHLLNQLDAARFEWLVPGLLREKVNGLVRGLPKQLRKRCLPVPECVTACLVELDRLPREGSLVAALGAALKRVKGIEVAPEAWDTVALPPHLKMNYRVVDADGDELASGRDLVALRAALGGAAQESFAHDSAWERGGITVWGDLALPESVQFRRAAQRLTGYPALVDEDDSVRLALADTAAKARQATRAGVNRLIRLALKEQVRYLERNLPGLQQTVLACAPLGGVEALKEDMMHAIVDRAVWADEEPVRDRKAFDARVKQTKLRLPVVAEEYCRLVQEILSGHQALRKLVASPAARACPHAVRDIDQQLRALVHPGFIRGTPYARLQHYPRYLKAVARRLEKLQKSPQAVERDVHHTNELARWRRACEQRREQYRKAGMEETGLEEFRWMLEEQRVSLFAQELKTPYPVSYRRLEKFWNALK